MMRILTQRIDASNEVCPRLGLVLGGTPFVASEFVRFVFPNSPCGRGGVLPHDIVLHINGMQLADIHRKEFSDRRRTELDFEIWRSFRHYRMVVHVEPEPFAPVGEIIALSRVFVARCPPQRITFRNPDHDAFREFLSGFRRRRSRRPR